MRVLICDDHRLFADSLGCLLRSFGHEVAWAADPVAAMEVLRREPFDACCIDLSFGGALALGAIGRAVVDAPQTAFVLLTGSEDSAVLEYATTCGVGGVAHKSDEVPELLATVAKTLAQLRSTRFEPATMVLSSAAALRFSLQEHREHRLARFLTPREQEVLTRLVNGETTSHLARSMGVRMSTARTHVDAVLTKLGAHSRGEAVAYAVREGLVTITETEFAAEAVG